MFWTAFLILLTSKLSPLDTMLLEANSSRNPVLSIALTESFTVEDETANLTNEELQQTNEEIRLDRLRRRDPVQYAEIMKARRLSFVPTQAVHSSFVPPLQGATFNPPKRDPPNLDQRMQQGSEDLLGTFVRGSSAPASQEPSQILEAPERSLSSGPTAPHSRDLVENSKSDDKDLDKHAGIPESKIALGPACERGTRSAQAEATSVISSNVAQEQSNENRKQNSSERPESIAPATISDLMAEMRKPLDDAPVSRNHDFAQIDRSKQLSSAKEVPLIMPSTTHPSSTRQALAFPSIPPTGHLRGRASNTSAAAGAQQPRSTQSEKQAPWPPNWDPRSAPRAFRNPLFNQNGAKTRSLNEMINRKRGAPSAFADNGQPKQQHQQQPPPVKKARVFERQFKDGRMEDNFVRQLHSGRDRTEV